MKAEEWNDKGVELSDRGKVDKAILAFSTALELEPANPRIIYNLALAFMKKDDWEAAERLLTRALSLMNQNPDPSEKEELSFTVDITVELGLCLYGKKDLDGAEACYLQALEKDPLNSRGWNNLGVVYFQKEQYGEAAESFRTSVNLDPENGDGWFNLRDSYEELGEKSKARQADRRWRELNS